MSAAFHRGFDWATDALLRGLVTREEIEVQVDAQGIDADDFDRGARAALRNFKSPTTEQHTC